MQTILRPPAIPPLIVSTIEAGRALSLHPSQIYDLVKAGRLTPIRIGDRSFRFAVRELERFTAAAQTEAEQEAQVHA